MVLMIYQTDIFREYVLPKANNLDYPIVLDKNQFHIKENITLNLEVSDNQWILHQSDDYTMKTQNAVCEEIQIQDGDIIFFRTVNGEKFQGIAVDSGAFFQVFRKFDMTALDYITIGKDSEAVIQYDFKDLISKNHGVIRKQADGYVLEDYSSNGMFVNYKRVQQRVRLHFGDVINIFGLHIVFLNEVIGIGSCYGDVRVDKQYLMEIAPEEITGEIQQDKKEKGGKIQYYNRSPRNIPNIHDEEVEIELPPGLKTAKKKPMLFTIGPSFTMMIPMMLGCFISILGARSSGRDVGIYMYTGIITAIGSAVVGVVWALLNLKYARQSEQEDEKLRFDAYGNYLIEIAEKLKKMYSENTQALFSMYLSAQECSAYDRKNANLWNRNSTHSDYLFVRLGVGDIPFQVKIKVPKEKFEMQQDALKEKPALLLNEYKVLRNVPVGIDIREKQLWGIVGGENRIGAIKAMYNIVAQIAANNCYTDVKMAFVYKENSHNDRTQWMFAKWLPHVWSADKKTRYVATNELEAKDVFYELVNIIRHRSEEATGSTRNVMPKPYYVLFLSDASLLEGELIKKYIYEPKPEYGIAAFIMSETYEGLPNVCENILQYDSSFHGFYNTMDTTGKRHSLIFDESDVYALTNMAKRLAQIQVNELESNADIPNSLDFMEMYGVNSLKELQVLERWRKNRTFHTMKALVGKKAGGSDCYLDIHEKYHGPHGLIAGTTGSGKSETLQTYMLSLALNFSPDDIGFFIIDFKGGGMANLFSGLPHLIGQISNLSGNQIRRAMISIKSENMRRQRIFSEYGVNNINLYTRLYKNNETPVPIPHLFIIIDEFAELKREEPDFMRELISVAQVGRSLGVHLILATQKPSGTVDDNIWSNSKFRLCLRVQDKQDSNDMLHKPDAAFITQAGRCYMQVGNDEIYELFQSGWSGATYDENAQEYAAELATMLTSTGKTAIVGSRAKIKRKEQEKHNYYKHIIEIIMSNMFTNKILNLVDADDARINELVKDVVEQMNQEGLEYEWNDSGIKRLRAMIRLWPKESMEPDKIAEYIMRRASMEHVRLPEVKEKTQLDAIVEYLKRLADENGYNHNLQLWLPLLPKEIYVQELIEDNSEFFDGQKWEMNRAIWNLEVPVGLYDDPENQSQAPLMINFSDAGHLVVCGSVVSGKSTFLQTLLYSLVMKYTPQDINIYGLDFSSGMLAPFEKMPHVGGILDSNDLEGVGKLFHMLVVMLEERKKLLGGGNYAQYVKAYGVKVPAVFLVIDNYANFTEKTEGKYADLVMRISKEGVGYGIFLVVSCAGFGMAEVPGRMADNFKTAICLEMGDKFKYMDIMHITHVSVLPEADVKGRGLANVSGALLEFQTAMALKAEDDYQRLALISELAEKMYDVWTGKCAKKIPHIPENPIHSVFHKMDEVKEMRENPELIPIAYCEKDASVYGIPLENTYCYTISGKSKTGKTSLLKLIMDECEDKNGQYVVFEKGSTELQHMAEKHHAVYLSSDDMVFKYLKELLPEFARRNRLKQSYIASGMDEHEIYEKMKQEPPVFIYIADLAGFINCVYKPAVGVGDMKGFVENIMAKGELHNIFFFGIINSEDATGLSAYQVFKSFTGYRKGVHLGGNVATQRIFNFQNIPYAEAGKSLKKGVGLVPKAEEETMAEKIVIPMYGK